jgi:hypothetical protein
MTLERPTSYRFHNGGAKDALPFPMKNTMPGWMACATSWTCTTSMPSC